MIINKVFSGCSLKSNGTFFIIVLLSLFLLSACADKSRPVIKEQFEPGVFSVEHATELYGEPDAVMKQGDGRIRHSWIYHEEYKYRDRYYYVREGPFREKRIIPGNFVRNYCFFSIFTDDDGTVLGTNWDGNACDQMAKVHSFKTKVNSLPDKDSVIEVPVQ